MFTGLVEGMGEVVEAQKGQGMLRLKLAWSGAPELSPGESIAVDGVCLTVVEIDAVSFQVDVIQETLDLTTLGRVQPGDPVNLERSLRLGDRLGGHLVQGHVDAMATVESVVRRGGDVRVNLELSRELSRYVAHKGSITLNGVSLTVAAVRGRSLQVALIPETLRATNLGGLSAEDLVNVEVDLLARYLDRLLQDREPADDAPAGAPERRPTP